MLDGFQALRRIKESPKLTDTQVIVISASDDTEDKIAGFELGACDYVTKPFNLPELRARMRSALRIHELLTLLAERAQVDGLTGIGNRSCFDERIAEELSHRDRMGSDLTVALCDIDHFKKVNDSYGHAAGDEQNPEDWLKTADDALYAAKHAGRNRIYAGTDSGSQSALKLAS